MEKVIILVLFLIICGMIWSFPLYACVNLVFWLFHIPLHLTWLQSFGLCLLASVIRKLLFKKED